jgi:hypothetical protein
MEKTLSGVRAAGRFVLNSLATRRSRVHGVTLRGREAHPVGLLVLLWAVSCGSGSSSISAKGYPRNCVTVADCFPVFEGVVGCCGGGCPNTAIRQDAVAAFMTASEAARMTSCHGVQPPCPSGPMCTVGRVTCDNGVCGLASPPADAAAQE